MEAVITTVGGAILSASFQALFDRLGSSDLLKYVGDEYVVEELKKWKTKLKRIYLVLEDAEEKQMSDPLVKMWFSELRDLAYDVEDILDEFSTDLALRRKLEDEPQASTSKLSRFLPICCGRLNLATLKYKTDMISRIKSTTARLDEIIKQKDELVLVEGGRRKCNQIRERPTTTSLVNETQIYGRKKDKEAVMDMLIKAGVPIDAKPSVIPIVGMGGIGKTTLAQLIFNDYSLEFDLRSWVSVGEDFDVLRMTKAILQQEGGDNDLNSLQLKLKEKLSMKKFFIVLDDVWTENYDDWTRLCAPFSAGKHGSTLIVTTRSRHVSSMMGTIPAYSLHELSYDDCMLVFAQHALGAKHFDEYTELKEVGASIVKRCQGLPLAAKALGGILRGKPDRNVWMDVLKSEIWDLPEDRSNILPALRLSYFHLPSQLKQCFAYCAIFPKDYEFDAKELVLLWMAEGFLYQPKSMKPMEALGHQYFHELLSRSFFQQSGSNESQYVMHDLMNDLARHVSAETCFQLGDNLEDGRPYAMVRHSSFTRQDFDTWQKFEVFQKMKSLRTFLSLPIITDGWSFCHLTGKVLYELMPELKCLKVLSLAGYRFEELPSSIGALKHLRYLNLPHCRIRRLPESVVDLLNLQTLRLRGCEVLNELPLGIGSLINLHCLDIRDCRSLTRLPLGICNLKNLQCLDVSGTNQLEMPPQIGNLRNLQFAVGKKNGLKLTELKKLCHLEGRLDVIGLQNVVDIGDADFGYLKEQHDIEELNLEWDGDFSDSRNPSGGEKVLDSLRPHQNLSSLSISGYGEIELPSWIGDRGFSKMVKLNLRDCRKVVSLPPLGQLGALRELSIQGMNGVKEVGVELYGDQVCFGSLETLRIEDMEEWEKWCFFDDVNEEITVSFPKLRELEIVNCPKLVGKLPSCLPSLHKLCVERCRGTLVRSICDLTSLTTLVMREISGLVSLDEAVHIEDLVALQYLRIDECNELKHLWNNGTNLDKLASLKRIKIWECKQMVSLVDGEEGQLPCNLQVLQISDCDNLETIFKSCNLQLERLEIFCCKSLKWFPNVEFPDSLKTLRIGSCNWATELMESVSRKLDCPNGFPRLTELCIWDYSLPFSLQNLISLQHLNISSSDNLNCLQDLTSLRSLVICHCKKLNWIQNLTSLQSLFIQNCENLNCIENLISLQYLEIELCENLRSLPNFNSLQSLCIKKCGGLECFPGGLPSKLTSFTIMDCKNLSQPMSEWGLDRLTSLTKLRIFGTNKSTETFNSFPGHNIQSTSLTFLWISDCKDLESISNLRLGLPNLISLIITKCPNLRSLPQGTGYPFTLGCLEIFGCPLVNRRDYGSLISHIPCVYINDEDALSSLKRAHYLNPPGIKWRGRQRISDTV